MTGRSGTTMDGVAEARPERWRRGLLVLGALVTAFGILHHLDHVVRGNHSGWPFIEEVTPFTFSLLVYALLLPGIYMNLRGRLAAGWWLFTAVVALALVSFVHFLGGEEREAPIPDIYGVYDNPAWGALALAVLYGLILSLVALAVAAFRAVVASRARS
jgi:hypothetical protein